jgi:broad specificity phosphatase PhoE
MRLILSRHGQSLANIDPSYAGKDSVLTPLGEQQADCLGRWLKDHQKDIDLIICSPLRRARMTAEIANQYLNLPIEVNEDLMEVAKTDFPSMPRRKHPLQPDTMHYDAKSDGYYDEYRIQVNRALEIICKDIMRPNPTLVISHGGTAATLLRLILERHDVRFLTYNTAMHFVSWDNGMWQIDALNATPHLSDDMLS